MAQTLLFLSILPIQRRDLSSNDWQNNAYGFLGVEGGYSQRNSTFVRFPFTLKKSRVCRPILFSSGTTGEPKCIPWHHSTFMKPLSDGYLHNDVRKGEVVAWPTNVGWMMGPWLIAQLGLGSTLALFVGSPVSRSFCEFVEVSRIAHLGLIPSMVKAWMRLDATKGLNWSKVRRYSSTGEASNPTLYHWVVSRAGYSPVMEYGNNSLALGRGHTFEPPQCIHLVGVCPGVGDDQIA